MRDSDSQSVPRPPSEPSAEDLLQMMEPGTSYTVADFEDRFDVSRWTIRRRLEGLCEEGELNRTKHSRNVVTYQLATDASSAPDS